MRITRILLWLALIAAILPRPGVQAQQQSEQKPVDQAAPPVPAYRSPLASAAGDSDDEGLFPDPQKMAADTRSLAGAQVFSLGELAGAHTYWQPHVDMTSTADSNGLSASNNTGWTTWSSISGGVDLHRISGNSNLSLTYTGGATISNDGSAGNGVIQELGFVEKLMFRRLTFSLIDQFSYLPEAGFGFQVPGGLTLPGGGSIGLQPGLPPAQSILTARGQRISNAVVPQFDVPLTPRTSLTLVGTYSLLHYFDNGLLNYYSGGIQAGYNRQMTRKDTLALLYRFTAYRYSNFGQSIDDHTVQVSYGRRVTGKLAFQIAAGPEITSFQIPITGPNAGTAAAGNATTNLAWSLNTSLTYQLNRTQFGLAYAHGVSGGSGVQAGSVADTVTGNASRRLSRTFSGTASIGYARNSGLTVVSPSSTSTASQTFGYWTGNLGLSHTLGRTMNLGLNYLFQLQGSNGTFCVGPTCGASFTRHEVSLTLGWHERPLPF